jgi:tetratricopeptide (TPR) repeat protein
MDSVLSLTNIALTYDDKLSDVYTLRGKYYHEIWKPEQALEEYDKAIKLNPNDWMAYYEKGESYYNNDFLNMINYIRKAASVNRGAVLPYLLGEIGTAYAGAGFSEKANNYYLDKLKLDGDSLSYYGLFGWNEFWLGNFNKFLEYEEKAYVLDSTNGDINFMLGEAYSWLGRYKEALKYKKKEFEKLKSQKEIDVSNMHRMGIVFWQNGYKKEAEYCFNKQIENCNRSIELKRSYVGQILFTYYDLAGVYAFRGEKDKAYKNLRIFNQLQKMPLWMVTFIKTDPFFNNIRNDPEFQQIAREIESKCQAEHERVRKSLEERGPL